MPGVRPEGPLKGASSAETERSIAIHVFSSPNRKRLGSERYVSARILAEALPDAS